MICNRFEINFDLAMNITVYFCPTNVFGMNISDCNYIFLDMNIKDGVHCPRWMP